MKLLLAAIIGLFAAVLSWIVVHLGGPSLVVGLIIAGIVLYKLR